MLDPADHLNIPPVKSGKLPAPYRVCIVCGKRKLLRWFGVADYETGRRELFCNKCEGPEVTQWRAERRALLAGRSKGRNAATCAKRRAWKLQATPYWADMSAIKRIYAEAQELTEQTGIVHHVDHVIPLNNPLVCGLHVETNLQILTAEENMKKSNWFIADWESAGPLTAVNESVAT